MQARPLENYVVLKTRAINDELPIEAQMAVLSFYAYNDEILKYFYAGNGWLLIESIGSKYGLQAKLFRKMLPNGKFSYTITFRGTDSWADLLNNINQIGINSMKGQAYEAHSYANHVILRYLPNMESLYFTGHSLGGYLTQWVQSEIEDGRMFAPIKTAAFTFNAPGFTKLKHVTNPYYLSVKRKLEDPKKYTTINNYKIKGDPVSLIGTVLGKQPVVLEITHPLHGFDAVELHAIKRFLEYFQVPIL